MSNLFPDANPSPEHPNRPDHPDFRMLAQVIQDIDSQADLGVNITDLIGVDFNSLMYIADQRLLRISGTSRWYESMSPNLKAALLTLYADAFTLGASFERARTDPNT